MDGAAQRKTINSLVTTVAERLQLNLERMAKEGEAVEYDEIMELAALSGLEAESTGRMSERSQLTKVGHVAPTQSTRFRNYLKITMQVNLFKNNWAEHCCVLRTK